MSFTNRVLAAAVAATLSAGAASAAVTFAPTAPGPFEIGDTLTFEVNTDAGFPTFFGFDGFLSFDAALLDLTNVEINPGLDFQFIGPTEPQPILVSGGVILNPDLSGAQLLASFEFEALAEGTADELFDLLIINSEAEVLFDSELASSAQIGTSPIPLPASALLLISGISGISLLRRRTSPV
jgi:hypothetical protein